MTRFIKLCLCAITASAAVISIIWMVAAIFLFIAFLSACTMTRGPVTKQATEPPYMGEMHGGMDRAVYLRVEEALDAD